MWINSCILIICAPGFVFSVRSCVVHSFRSLPGNRWSSQFPFTCSPAGRSAVEKRADFFVWYSIYITLGRDDHGCIVAARVAGPFIEEEFRSAVDSHLAPSSGFLL